MTDYTEFRQRLYRPRVPLLWWLRRRSYLIFVLRELSSAFVAWTVVFTLMLVRAVGQGVDEYRQFLAWAERPWIVLINVVAVVFLVFHAVTWFNVAPQAIVARVRGRRVPAVVIAGLHFAGWLVVSAFVAWIVLG